MAGLFGNLSDDDVPMEDEYGCSRCKSTPELNPNLELRFTTCCGLALCKSCISDSYASRERNSTVECPGTGCQQRIKKQQFSKDPLDVQKEKRGPSIRNRINKTYNKEKRDFVATGSLTEEQAFEEYLTMKADLEWDWLHGSKEAQRRAEAQVKKYAAEHAIEIKRRSMRKEQEELDRFRKEKGKPTSAMAVVAPAVPNVFSLGGQGPSGPKRMPVRDTVQNPKVETLMEKCARLQRRLHTFETSIQPTPGGFFPLFHQKRVKEEALSDLGFLL